MPSAITSTLHPQVLDWLTDEFNPRELATLTWLLIAVVYVLAKRDLRASVWEVIKTAAAPIFAISALIATAWFVGLIYVASRYDLWNADLRNDTVVAVLAGILTTLGSSNAVGDRFFHQAIRRAIEAGALLGAFVGLGTLSYLLEMLLLPVATLLTLAVTVAQPGQEVAKRAAERLLMLIGIVVMAAVVRQVVRDADPEQSWRAFLLPVWMAVGAIPLSYAFGLFVHYDSAWRHLAHRGADLGYSRGTVRRARLALVLGLNVQARHVNGWAHPWPTHLLGAQRFRDAAEVVRIFRENWIGMRRQGRADDARSWFQSWTEDDQPDEVVADLHFDALARAWERLDRLQRDEFVRGHHWYPLDERRESQLLGLPDWSEASGRIARADAHMDALISDD